MAVKSKPVVGVVVICPSAPAAATCNVSTVSVDWQVFPVTKTPPRHSSSKVGGCGSTVPVRSAPAGLRIKWLVKRVMSNALRPSEFWMNTETRS